MPDWLDDLALESVAPPPVWLPNRAARLADAALERRRHRHHLHAPSSDQG